MFLGALEKLSWFSIKGKKKSCIVRSSGIAKCEFFACCSLLHQKSSLLVWNKILFSNLHLFILHPAKFLGAFEERYRNCQCKRPSRFQMCMACCQRYGNCALTQLEGASTLLTFTVLPASFPKKTLVQ